MERMKMLLRDMSGVPIVVAGLAAAGFASPVFWIAAGTIGGAQIIRDSIQKIRERRYSLDYIALLAVVLSLATGQYLAGAVVALMITGGEALDAYASRRAENALRALADRIPKSCTIRLSDGTTIEKPIQDVAHGETILVRAHEIVPLDGILRSPAALLDSANLTGEAIPVDFTTGAFIKSGNINVGDLIELSVDGSAETSTYHRIVHLVDDAKQHQPHAVRLAERVNFPFTAITLVLATIAWLISGELTRALAVLVIATPCPLLIAAPVAFIGGMSRAAHRNIIVKRPATLETLDRVSVVFFDKTGTLTLGEPSLAKIEILQSARTEDDILSIAASIELRSIHPLARTIVNAARAKHLPAREAHDTRETIGSGIRGTIDGSRFSISRSTHAFASITVIPHPSIIEGLTHTHDSCNNCSFSFSDTFPRNVILFSRWRRFVSLTSRRISSPSPAITSRALGTAASTCENARMTTSTDLYALSRPT